MKIINNEALRKMSRKEIEEAQRALDLEIQGRVYGYELFQNFAEAGATQLADANRISDGASCSVVMRQKGHRDIDNPFNGLEDQEAVQFLIECLKAGTFCFDYETENAFGYTRRDTNKTYDFVSRVGEKVARLTAIWLLQNGQISWNPGEKRLVIEAKVGDAANGLYAKIGVQDGLILCQPVVGVHDSNANDHACTMIAQRRQKRK